MLFDLWDLGTGNIVNTYASEDEALVDVLDLLEQNGSEYARELSLGYVTADDRNVVIAEGAALAERARRLGRANAAG
jgi:hypothetical protein